MLHALALLGVDYTYNNTYTPSSPAETATVFGFLLIVGLAFLALAIVMLVGIWKMYIKAGRPGWASIVPFYNMWVLAEIGGKPGWWGLYPLLVVIPFVGSIAAIVISIMIALGVARNFGKSDVFGIIGLWLFATIGYLILGFGSATYNGGQTSGMPTNQTPAAPPTPIQ